MDATLHSRRLRNLADAGRAVHSCLREQSISNYLAGQVTYNLGEYPARFSIAPTEYDEQLLAQFAAHGVTLLQLHEEWNDSQRRLGAAKLTSHDPAGLRRFIDLAHSLDMKVIVYASTGFFEATDPDFRREWAHPDSHLVELYYDYARCSPASPGWRAYILPRLERVMDEYGVDGLYDDLGYLPLHQLQPGASPDISPGPEDEYHDSALEDLLGLVMALVHRRGGVLKIHHSGSGCPHSRERIYDYLWVGEGVQDLDRLREDTKNLPPYVVPCPDMSRAAVEREDDLYLHSAPYMQFPLRVDGRPVTGERAEIPGVNYRHGEADFWTHHMRTVWREHQANPVAPPMYGWWDSFPGRPEARARWFHHLDLYRPMVKDGTRAWMEIRDGALFASPLPAGITASLFVNDETYLVLANYSRVPVEIVSAWTWQDRETSAAGQMLTVPPRSLRYYLRTVQHNQDSQG
jgi:hypothetical protein